MPDAATIHGRFAAVASAHPYRCAISSGSMTLSYVELADRVEQFSATLLRAGAAERQVVAVRLPPSVNYVVAVLGILATGAAYVPLHTKDPERRASEILRDSGASHLVTPDGLVRLEGAGHLPFDSTSAGEHPAYVMYTSGSTGRPKGIVIPHRAVLRLVVDTTWIQLDESARTLCLSPLAFDASTFELWAPLLNGGQLVLPEAASVSLASLAAEIARNEIIQLWLPSGIFALMVDHHLSSLASVRHLIAGGDVLSPRHVEKANAALDDCAVLNGYGPTENTTFSTVYRVPKGENFDESVPIGVPIDKTYVRILNDDLEPVEPGAVGQLAVGGDGLALGYLNDAALTRSRFIPDPQNGAHTATLYLTGDLARERRDGNLLFLGRGDDQVKIRGHRVECAEVEVALLRDRARQTGGRVPGTAAVRWCAHGARRSQ